jgi:RNA polymerase sigma-70 factor (ECF subfamily)
VKKGIERALERYLPRLYGYSLSLTGNRDAAQDLLQDCAVKALSTDAVPAADGALRAWLFRILRNAWIDRHRLDRLEFVPEPPEPPPEGSEHWRHDDRLISSIAVRQAIGRLSSAEREIITLVDLGGFSYAEAASILDVPVGTVMSRLSRARRALLEAIGETNLRPLRSGYGRSKRPG